jgi:predicted nucleic acid-binding protein
MIYLDTSVALAHLLGETRRPPDSLWSSSLITSRLQYELWTIERTRAGGLAWRGGSRVARDGRIGRARPVGAARAIEPFPIAVRTLDALHLSTLLFVRGEGSAMKLATYDERLAEAAVKLGVPLWEG